MMMPNLRSVAARAYRSGRSFSSSSPDVSASKVPVDGPKVSEHVFVPWALCGTASYWALHLVRNYSDIKDLNAREKRLEERRDMRRRRRAESARKED